MTPMIIFVAEYVLSFLLLGTVAPESLPLQVSRSVPQRVLSYVAGRADNEALLPLGPVAYSQLY